MIHAVTLTVKMQSNDDRSQISSEMGAPITSVKEVIFFGNGHSAREAIETARNAMNTFLDSPTMELAPEINTMVPVPRNRGPQGLVQ